MKYVATRRLRFRGTDYNRGDEVPASNSKNRHYLILAGKLMPVPDEGTDNDAGEKPLDDMSKAELMARAEELGIEYTTRTSKAELIDAITANAGNSGDDATTTEPSGDVDTTGTDPGAGTGVTESDEPA